MRTGAGNYFRKHTSQERRIRWFLFANRTRAVWYRDLPGDQFRFVGRLENPHGSRMEKDWDSDRPGTGMSSAGNGTIRHALDKTFHRVERNLEGFAGAIGRQLEQALMDQAFTELILVAEPRFLGILRAHLPASVASRVVQEIRRELTQGSDQELRSAALRAWEEEKEVDGPGQTRR
jgi:protein required for attachment to host cells